MLEEDEEATRKEKYEMRNEKWMQRRGEEE